jgi:tRNA nucleotidyltransferase (CCA-adding enzyme)
MVSMVSLINKQLPPELVSLLRLAGETASRQEQKLYLVGGVVRDLLLERASFDLDLVVEGNAIDLAQKLVQTRPGKITTHPRFGTAKIQWPEWSLDLATARSETYSRPGALPTVKPGSISDDLFRRDFTINAMAVHLDPEHYGETIDLYGGREDLQSRLIRVLHNRSFTDDATRIWRALRYEQRLDCRLERNTHKLLTRDAVMLETISGDRIRHELELIFKEELPEKIIYRAEELGVLDQLHPALRGNGELAELYNRARNLTAPSPPPAALYLALLIYPLNSRDLEKLIVRLRPPKTLAVTLQDTISIAERIEQLQDPTLAPSRIYQLLQGHAALAITAGLLTTDSSVARRHIRLYQDKLRYARTALTGDDLIKMGIPAGPGLKTVMERLLAAKMDEEVASRREEEEMVKKWLHSLSGQ